MPKAISTTARFCGEFHARSAFSFLRGANPPAELVSRAAELGYQHLALTDHGGFYGSARAHHQAKQRKENGLASLRAVVGATWELPDGAALPLLCASAAGYQALSRSLTSRHLEGMTALPRFGDFVPGGLIALSGDREGPVCRPLLRGDRATALAAAQQLVEHFGAANVFIEINRHGLRDDPRLNRALVDLADHLKLPLLACGAVLQARRSDRLLADAFTCLRHKTSLDAAGKLLAANGERYLKSPAQMETLFADLPAALEGTEHLAGRLDFSLEKLGYRFPDYPDEAGQDLPMEAQSRLLREMVFAQFHRFDPAEAERARAQLEHELALIHRLGFSGYFLIVHDIIDFARQRGILAQGRGSAANSAVCYSLGITRVDSVKQKLLFERFLSQGQSSWPDIDIDFPSGEQREEVIQYVFQKYGARGAAMTANVITYQPRSAFREMAKVLGFPDSVADRFSSEGSSRRWNEHDTHSSGSARVPAEEPGSGVDPPAADPRAEFRQRIAGIVPANHPRLAALETLYHAVLGLPRHLGQHSGGMIVCAGRLDSVVPIQPATMPGRTVVQWDKDDCEDLGIIKIDLLGLGMLAAMEDMVATCARRGIPNVLNQIDLEDAAVYEMMCRADTVGTFQVESRAQMATLPRFRPHTFYDVAMQVAIIRPGPIVGELVHPLIERRNDPSQIDLIHPDCADILERTYGVALFQEQVLAISMRMAGFSGAEANELRRAIGFTRSDERLQQVQTKLEARLRERGYEPLVREKIIQSLGSFALYGFPESHALSFAWIAYASCWLKLHQPGAFYVGLINHQPMGFYSVHSLIQDARRHGLRFLPVSVIHSLGRTELVEDHTIRLGLSRIKGLARATLERMISERCRAPFADLEDFLRRVHPSARERRLLAQAGALNDLPNIPHRRAALWQAELPLRQGELPFDDAIKTAQPTPTQPAEPQAAATSIFTSPSRPISPPALPQRHSPHFLPPMSLPERLAADFATQGASVGPHPMTLWRRHAPPPLRHLPRAADLAHCRAGQRLQLAGLVICRQRPGTAKGHCFISLEDETGIANLFVPRATFERLRLIIVTESFLLASGPVQIDSAQVATLFVEKLEPLPQANTALSSSSHDFY